MARKQKATKAAKVDQRYKNAAKYKIDYDAKRKSRFLNVRAAMLATEFSVGEANQKVHQQKVERIVDELDPRFQKAADLKLEFDDGEGWSIQRCMLERGFKEEEANQAIKQQRVRRLITKTKKMLKEAAYVHFRIDTPISKALEVAGFVTREEQEDEWKWELVERGIDVILEKQEYEKQLRPRKCKRPSTVYTVKNRECDNVSTITMKEDFAPSTVYTVKNRDHDNVSTITMNEDFAPTISSSSEDEDDYQSTMYSDDDHDEPVKEISLQEAIWNCIEIYGDKFSVESMSTDTLGIERLTRPKISFTLPPERRAAIERRAAMKRNKQN